MRKSKRDNREDKARAGAMSTSILLYEAISKFNNVEVEFYDMNYIKDYYSKF